MSDGFETFGVEVVWVGSAGHLKRYKVVDSNGRFVPGGLFRSEVEARKFIFEQTVSELEAARDDAGSEGVS